MPSPAGRSCYPRRFPRVIHADHVGEVKRAAMPKFVPQGSEIRCPFFINLLFSTPEAIAEYWPIAAVDPRSPM